MYYQPSTLDEALSLLHEGPKSIAAGCTDLFAATQARALGGPVLDITRIERLRAITSDKSGVRIGAAATWRDLLKTDLPPSFDMLKQAAREVGSVQIQAAGTIAGNICNASPAADGVPCLLALDASAEVSSVSGRRVVPLTKFITGVRQVDLVPGDLVTAILIPHHALGGSSRFLKLGARKYLVISIAMVAVRLSVEEGRVADIAVAVGSCSPVARRLTALEARLVGLPLESLSESVTESQVEAELDPIDDIRADAAYRLTAATALTRRALADLAGASP